MNYFIDLSLLRKNRDFRCLYIGQFISFFGTMITRVALPYQIYHETHSTLMVGLLSLLQLVPLLFTALLGGVLADRHNQRLLLLMAESLLAISCMLLAFNAYLTVPHLWVIFVLSPFMAAVNGLHRPSLESIVQRLVDTKDFSAVASLATFKAGVCMIGGPAIGGLIIAHLGIATTFMVDVVSFLVSLIALAMINYIPPPKILDLHSAWHSLQQGFRYVT